MFNSPCAISVVQAKRSVVNVVSLMRLGDSVRVLAATAFDRIEAAIQGELNALKDLRGEIDETATAERRWRRTQDQHQGRRETMTRDHDGLLLAIWPALPRHLHSERSKDRSGTDQNTDRPLDRMARTMSAMRELTKQMPWPQYAVPSKASK